MAYNLQKQESDAEWLTLSKTSGTIPQYDIANPTMMKETIKLSVLRNGLQAGEYQCTLIVGSDLEYLEIPVSMKVKEWDTKLEVSPTGIVFSQDKEMEAFTIKNVGNSGAFEWKVMGEGAAWLSFAPISDNLAILQQNYRDSKRWNC